MELGDLWGPFQLKLFYDSMKNHEYFQLKEYFCIPANINTPMFALCKEESGNFSFKKRDSEKVGKLLKNKQSRDKMFPGIPVWLKLHTRGLL